MQTRRRRSSAALLAALATGACTGHLGDAGSPDQPAEGASVTPPASSSGRGPAASPSTAGSGPFANPVEIPTTACGAEIDPGPSPIRRLTTDEYANTVQALLGIEAPPVTAREAGDLLVDEQMAAAVSVAARVKAEAIFDCDARTDACVQASLATFARRAFRRPVRPDEIAHHVQLFTRARADAGVETAVRLTVEAFLQSPHFLYRPEVGGPAAKGASTAALTPWEVASRLSYLLLRSMPDAELFRAAETGGLATVADVEKQARRLLRDPRARPMLARFHELWLGYDRVTGAVKDKKAYPAFTPETAALMVKETSSFLDHVIFDGAGDLKTLLTADFSFMNRKLAAFYGVTGPAGEAVERVTLDRAKRMGLLTHASLLAANGYANQSDPIHRGQFVREALLCGHLPDAPANLVIEVPDVRPDSTTRERFAQHAKDPACAGCHRLMDPIGLGFENYDGAGQWRTMDAGKPVDASGEIAGTDVAGPFTGAVALAHRLAASRDAADCHVLQWFRYTLGRGETAADACVLDGLKKAFARSSGRVLDLVVALTTSPAFLTRRASAP